MKTCERLVQSANFCPKQPVSLLAYSYCELLEQKKPILGKSLTLNDFVNFFRYTSSCLERMSYYVFKWPSNDWT